jgi:hypothetical protein
VFKAAGSPVFRQSRMQLSVAISCIETEYMTASPAKPEAMCSNILLQQLGHGTSEHRTKLNRLFY